MARLPKVSELTAASVGTGFFLCARKERRTGRGGPYLVLLLQDASGEVDAKVFQEVETAEQQFEVGEFVAVQGKGNQFNRRLELLVDRIRRVLPDDSRLGFREEDCIPCAPRPIDEMWTELEARIAGVGDPDLRRLLGFVTTTHRERLRIWPAARQIHHAYRSGLLEHVLKVMEVAGLLADAYGARRDLVITGALLHDLGKLEELDYRIAVDYSLEGNLLGHIVLGVRMLQDALRQLPGFPAELATEVEHLILSHHGEKERGSPVPPMTTEAFILAAADELDARLHQVRRHVEGDPGDSRFTPRHRYLERVLLKPAPGE